jgi:hypothetical protein
MAGAKTFRSSPASEMTVVLLVFNLVVVFIALHLNRWAMGTMFFLALPLAATKAFLDYRRKRDIIARNSIL